MATIVKREQLAEKLDFQDQVGLMPEVEMASVTQRRVVSQDEIAASGKGRVILEEAQEEARRIRSEAQGVLNRIQEEMEKAKARGYEEGREEGMKEVSELMVKAGAVKDKLFHDIEKETVKLVYDIAEKVIGAELAQRDTAIVDMVRQALSTAIGSKIMVLVNPADLEALKNNQVLLMQAIDSSRTLQLRGDERVKPKGCTIETEIGTIDAQLDTQLSAIKRALGIDA